MTKDEMKKRLDDMGVDYDASATKGELAELIQANKGAAEGKVICKVRRDFWPTEKQEDRVCKGEIVEVDAMAAIEGIEKGMLERVR